MKIPTLRTIRAGLDLGQLRYQGEAELRAEIERTPELMQAVSPWLGAGGDLGAVQGALEASPLYAPAIAKLLEIAKRTLCLQPPVRLLLHPFASPRIAQLDHSREPLNLLASSGVFAGLTLREGLFVLGRQLGRPFLGSWPLWADPSSAIADPRNALLLRGLWRFQELSLDRVGVVCCQNAAIAARAMIKVATGLPNDLVAPDLRRLTQSVPDEEEALLHGDETTFLKLRLAVLERFASSELYAECFDSAPQADPAPADVERAGAAPAQDAPSPGRLSAVRILRPVPEMPEVLEEVASPATPATAPPMNRDALDRLRRAAVDWLLRSGPGPRPGQRRAYARLFGKEPRADSIADPAYLGETCRRLATSLAALDLDERLGLLRDVLGVTAADGRLLPRESAAVDQLASWLGVSLDDAAPVRAEFLDPEFVDYRFEIGQEVEVHLDGRWVQGKVQQAEPGGELRVELLEDQSVLPFSPRADLIRPRARRAG